MSKFRVIIEVECKNLADFIVSDAAATGLANLVGLQLPETLSAKVSGTYGQPGRVTIQFRKVPEQVNHSTESHTCRIDRNGRCRCGAIMAGGSP